MLKRFVIDILGGLVFFLIVLNVLCVMVVGTILTGVPTAIDWVCFAGGVPLLDCVCGANRVSWHFFGSFVFVLWLCCRSL